MVYDNQKWVDATKKIAEAVQERPELATEDPGEWAQHLDLPPDMVKEIIEYAQHHNRSAGEWTGYLSDPSFVEDLQSQEEHMAAGEQDVPAEVLAEAEKLLAELHQELPEMLLLEIREALTEMLGDPETEEIREEVQKLSLRDIQEMDFSRELLEEFINQLTGDVTQEVLEESRQEGVEDISR